MSSLGVVIFSITGMNLNRCLESVQWVDAVFILHKGDGEPEMKGEWPTAPVVRRWLGDGGMPRWQDEIRTDWVLHLWGEEWVETSLKEELQALCRAERSEASSYRIPIRSYLLGQWVEGSLWEPVPALRLRRRPQSLSIGWWRAPEEETGSLQGWIGDYSAGELKQGFERLRRLCHLWSKQAAGEDPLHGFAPWLLPMRIYFRLLFLKGLIRQGMPGLTLSTLAAYTALLSGAKLWETRLGAAPPNAPNPNSDR